MAGERKGKTYEALVKVALDQLKLKGKLTGDVFWNVKASGMTVTPDFTIGPDADNPEIVLLVTHSGSVKNSDMKAWRNLGELAECKLRLNSVPRVYSIAFESLIKQSLKNLGGRSFDGQVLVGEAPYGRELGRWVDANHARLPSDVDGAVVVLLDLIAKKDATFLPPFSAFVVDLETLLTLRQPALDSLWARERLRRVTATPTARITFVRRGLSKLLVFDDLEMALRLYRGKRVPLGEVPDYAFELGLATKSIGRGRPNDAEIRSAIDLLTDDQITSIIKGFNASAIEGWLRTLRNIAHLRYMGDYVTAEHRDLCNPNILRKRLLDLHADPSALKAAGAVPVNWPPANVWLLEYLVEVIRLHSGSANGYGYAQLGREVLAAGFTKRKKPGNPRIWVGGFILSDWVHRRGAEDMPPEGIRGMAEVLAKRLKAIAPAELNTIIKALPATAAKHIIEAKLVTYKEFDPTHTLLKQSVPGFSDTKVRSCFAEAAGLVGQTAVIQLGRAASTVINWQSATTAGKDHKVKELCGRAVAIRNSWNAKTKRFEARPGIKKLILVVDGSWSQSDLENLVRAGWDEIFYPNEMDKLAKAVV